MSYNTDRELGILRSDVDHLKEKVDEVYSDVKHIRTKLDQKDGASKLLTIMASIVGGVAGAAIALISKFF